MAEVQVRATFHETFVDEFDRVSGFGVMRTGLGKSHFEPWIEALLEEPSELMEKPTFHVDRFHGTWSFGEVYIFAKISYVAGELVKEPLW